MPFAAATAPPPTIVVVGDSLSAAHGIAVDAGWVTLLADRLDRQGYVYHVVNASVSGNTTSAGLARLPGLLDRDSPAIVILELGGNDGLRGQSVTRMAANLGQMIRLSHQARARVLLVGLRMPTNYGGDYGRRFHRVYLDLADRTGVALVPKLLAGVAENPRFVQADGIHPTAAAQPIILDNVWRVLKPLLRPGSSR